MDNKDAPHFTSVEIEYLQIGLGICDHFLLWKIRISKLLFALPLNIQTFETFDHTTL